LLLSSTDTAGIWGRGGAIAGENGRVYGQTADGPFDPAKGEFSNTVVAGSIPELDLLDYFVPKDWQQVSKDDLDMGSNSPVWFRFQNYNLLLGGGKQAIAWLMDADSLGGDDHQTPLWSSHLGNDQRSMQEQGFWGGFSTWLDEAGERWVALPLWGPLSKDAPNFPLTNGANPHGSIMAFKVKLDAATHKPVIDPGWVSGDLDLPDPVVVAKGVLFALSTGENANQETDRIVNTRPAVLYALDAKTGKVLFQSGDAMKTWVHFSGLAVANTRVYAVDHDSWVYCFGPRDR
jgi:outer membrane protein assembly factor BamB